MKKVRSDNTYMISTDSTENPKLGAKVLSGGTGSRESLFLDFYYGCSTVRDEISGKTSVKKKRRREYLKLYLHSNPRSQQERQENKKTLELARSIRTERAQQLLEQTKGYRLDPDNALTSIDDFFFSYISSYSKKDIRMIRCAMERFRNYLISTYGQMPASQMLAQMTPAQITSDMVTGYADYLQDHSKGLGAQTIFARFKKVMRYALRHGYIHKDPTENIFLKADSTILRKEVLSLDEQEQLIRCHYKGENPEVRRAFILCLYCGLRFCDVSELTYRNVDFQNKLLRFEQRKTKGHSSVSGVIIPLTDDLVNLLGKPEKGKEDAKVFQLPTYGGCVSDLKSWTRHAGITKHITWHCARHSFAVSILNNGANIKTLSSLLGHSNINQTEKYTRVVDKLKEDAINSLPKLHF